MIKITFCACVLLAGGVALGQTQVPHIFQAGAPARAAEVNVNFNTLETALDQLDSRMDNAVQQLASRLNSVEGAIAQTTDCDPGYFDSPHQPTSGAVQTAPGMEVTILGEQYRMHRFPFIEYSTGERFVIDLPLIERNIGNQTRITAYHTNDIEPTCSNRDINGYPGIVEVRDYRDILISQSSLGYTIAQYSTNAFALVTVKVGQTVLIIEIPSFELSDRTALPCGSTVDCQGSYDHTDEVIFEFIPHPDDFLNTLDQYISFIDVFAAPQ